MKENNVISVDFEQARGRRICIGFQIENQKEHLWVSDAERLAKQLSLYKGFKVATVNSETTRTKDGESIACFDFFARYDTVYILSFKGTPLTLFNAID